MKLEFDLTDEKKFTQTLLGLLDNGFKVKAYENISEEVFVIEVEA